MRRLLSERGGLSGGLRVGAEFGDQSGPSPPLCRAPVPGPCACLPERELPLPQGVGAGRAARLAGCPVGHSPLGPHGSWLEAQVLGQEHGRPLPYGTPRCAARTFAHGESFHAPPGVPSPLPPEPTLKPRSTLMAVVWLPLHCPRVSPRPQSLRADTRPPALPASPSDCGGMAPPAGHSAPRPLKGQTHPRISAGFL